MGCPSPGSSGRPSSPLRFPPHNTAFPAVPRPPSVLTGTGPSGHLCPSTEATEASSATALPRRLLCMLQGPAFLHQGSCRWARRGDRRAEWTLGLPPLPPCCTGALGNVPLGRRAWPPAHRIRGLLALGGTQTGGERMRGHLDGSCCSSHLPPACPWCAWALGVSAGQLGQGLGNGPTGPQSSRAPPERKVRLFRVSRATQGSKEGSPL